MKMTDAEEQDLIDEILEGGPIKQRMIVIKTIGDDALSAEDSDGQMIMIDMAERTIKSLLHGDKDWVHGELTNINSTWEVIGFYMGMTDGFTMDKVRNVTH
jgi:hypothetical protein